MADLLNASYILACTIYTSMYHTDILSKHDFHTLKLEFLYIGTSSQICGAHSVSTDPKGLENVLFHFVLHAAWQAKKK